MYDKEKLNELINVEGLSYEAIGKIYGITGAAIKKAAKKLGVKLPVRRKINDKESFNKGKQLKYETRYCAQCGREIERGKYTRFCSSACFHEYMFEERVKSWKETPELYCKEDMPSFIRRYLFAKYGGRCSNPGCGWCEVNPYSGEVPLEVHHIDGDCTNNQENNLVLLCPNCHSLTNNHGSLNNGNSKRYKLKQYRKRINES